MKKFFKIFSILFFIFALSGAVIYYFFPSVLVNSQIKYTAFKAKIENKTILAGEHQWHYFESGSKNKENIVFLHGYGVTKSDWLSYLISFKDQYRVFAPDLPGFGKNKAFEKNKYTLENYAQYLNEWIDALKLKKVHIVGLSMGGTLAGYYAALYPQKVSSLIMIDPGGIEAFTMTPFLKKYLDTGINDLDYTNINEFDTMISLIYHKPVLIPYYIKNYAVKDKKKHLEIQKKIFHDFFKTKPYLLSQHLNQITAPALVLWGEKDQLFHVSSVERVKKNLKSAEIHIFKDCGHVPLAESPVESFELISNFIKKNQEKQ